MKEHQRMMGGATNPDGTATSKTCPQMNSAVGREIMRTNYENLKDAAVKTQQDKQLTDAPPMLDFPPGSLPRSFKPSCSPCTQISSRLCNINCERSCNRNPYYKNFYVHASKNCKSIAGQMLQMKIMQKNYSIMSQNPMMMGMGGMGGMGMGMGMGGGFGF